MGKIPQLVNRWKRKEKANRRKRRFLWIIGETTLNPCLAMVGGKKGLKSNGKAYFHAKKRELPRVSRALKT